MIQYICDICGRKIEVEKHPHFKVSVEIEAVQPPSASPASLLREAEEDDDFLSWEERYLQGEEIDDLEDLEEEPDRERIKSLQFDLCADCFGRYLSDPLMGKLPRTFGFSQN
jgi:hypothetical protein